MLNNDLEAVAGNALALLAKNKRLIDQGIIDFEKALVAERVPVGIRNMLIAYYLTQIMYGFTASIADTPERHKEIFHSLGIQLHRECIKCADDVAFHERVKAAMTGAMQLAALAEIAKQQTIH